MDKNRQQIQRTVLHIIVALIIAVMLSVPLSSECVRRGDFCCAAKKAENTEEAGKAGKAEAAGETDKAGKAEAAEETDKDSNSASEVLGEIAEGFAKAACRAVGDASHQLVSRREVYRLKSGARVSRKEIRRRGGSKRWFQIYKIKKGDRVYKRIAGRSYKSGGAVKLSDLRYIRVLYCDFRGRVRSGEIIVSLSIADDTRAVFMELYKAKYQIRKMRLVDDYFPSGKTSTWTSAAAEAADTASMNDDNTSGFNYRMVAGTSSVSMHGYGRAIDINPFENPWCPGGTVYYNQKASAAYADRTNVRPHMILAGSNITKTFKKHGFRWLGEAWTRDYQHFEK